MATGGKLSVSLSRGNEEVYEFCCTPCSQVNDIVEALHQCLDCDEHFCAKCIDFHSKFGAFSGHKVLDRNEMKRSSLLNQPKNNHVYNANLRGDYNVKVGGDPGTCLINGTCLMPDGTVVLTDWNNRRIKHLNTSYKVADYCDLPDKPIGVTCITPNEVAVALRDSCKVVFVSIGRFMSVSRSFCTMGLCRGICFIDERLFVSCGQAGAEHLAVYDIHGMLLRVVQNDKNGMPVLVNPSHVRFNDTDSCIYVGGWDRYVRVFDRALRFVGKFNDHDLDIAYDMCFLDNGTILACGHKSNNVIQFDSDGRRKSTLLTSADIKGRWSLCYDSRKSILIVAMSNTDIIKVFELK